VLKSGCPILRLMTSCPCDCNSLLILVMARVSDSPSSVILLDNLTIYKNDFQVDKFSDINFIYSTDFACLISGITEICISIKKETNMQTFLDILKYTLPSLIIFIVVFIIIKAFLENMQNRHVADLKSERQKVIAPVKVQAYERTVLFLERITPGNLILRLTRSDMTSIQLQATLIRSVREEYEHNMSQQLYLSDQAWEMVKSAKEEIIRLINTCAAEVEPEAKNNDLAALILEKSFEKQNMALSNAMQFVKEEFRTSF
jgi:hypothetical protein